MKKRLCFIVGLLLATLPAHAAITWNAYGDCGIQLRNTIDSGMISVDLYAVNDNNDITFDRVEVCAQNIFDTLYRKIQQYGTFTGTKEEFLASLGSHFGIGTDSEVQAGWSTSMQTDGTVDWWHLSGGALPDIDYDVFTPPSRMLRKTWE